MATLNVTNLKELNLYTNPLLQGQGEFIQMKNVDSYPYGAKRKRQGYSVYLNAPDAATVNTLFDWHRNDGTTFWNYRASGSAIYYSTQGTGNWTICGNGTIANGAHLGHAVLEDTLIVGDGVGPTKHSTDGTSFTDTSGAPVAQYFEEYQGRIYAGGTANTLFYSTVGTLTDWITDSSSYLIGGPGKISGVFKTGDRLTIAKNSGNMFRFDGFSFFDMTTNVGPSSPYSVAKQGNLRIWINKNGYYAYSGGDPELFSNAIERQVYNREENAINGAAFGTSAGVFHRNNFLSSVGDITDDFSGETIVKTIQKYNTQSKGWSNYELDTNQCSWLSFSDNNQNQQLIFGDTDGNTYKFDNTLKDVTVPIEATLEMVLHAGTMYTKAWKMLRAIFNPGCGASIMVAFSDTYTSQSKNWITLGDARRGKVEYKLPDNRSVFMFIKIIDVSTSNTFEFYGLEVDYDVNVRT